ncbi:uncharacterized protein MYCFIDRAFT_212204 [Pseudocercospora fijiensis CIRAD86]|uniref:glucan endo-1,3-beta-D-glucosidase n=1 Tax=Pseudocercospora fijiensis (strain CIRAD86) TaxID=383855 RepID=M3A440_PSEFD|nr:uncharacterized protein MYCFIDRAFT_212204 [Pseudocercospora fijiensis CIRAD86]EME79386.1 hypothetical protein MYCFIDRAFT_212204 [Pseudocercospora fijiensis CIRAD86]
MKYLYSAAALFAASVSADLCAHGSTDVNGNWYCQEVKAITYSGVGGSGSYNKVTSMGSSGSCSSTPYGYSGSMAPLDEEVSMHFRGPLRLKQFAFYAPGSSSTKMVKARSARPSSRERRSALGHGHAHAHAHLHDKREADPDAAVGDLVTDVIDGKTVHWLNTYDGGASSAPASAQSYGSGRSSSSASTSGSAASSYSSSDDTISGSGWTRQGYYNAQDQTSEGIVFLNHEGGSGSGVFDMTYGNSLSYASTDGCSGASSPQILKDCQLKSDTEVVIMTDKKCSGDSCGFVRPGTVAYHGFNGPSKAFFFEFSMPDDGTTAASIYDPTNMPAIWMLNAQIPRTLQYGKADCSCWTSGCGEFDIFEVLAAGDKRCKSTLHGNIAGGDSDYFARPVDKTIKAALLLYKDNIHIKILDDSTQFGKTMDDTFLDNMMKDTMTDSLERLVSHFALSKSS